MTRVAVLGAGGVGRATAAMLCGAGVDTALWSPSGRGTAALADGTPLTASGAIEGRFRPRIAPSLADALEGASTAVIALPAYGHRPVMDALAPLLRPGMTAIVSAHYSLSALYLAQALGPRAAGIPIVAWGTTVIMGRPSAPDGVAVLTLRAMLDAAVLPGARADDGLAACRALFGDRFRLKPSLLAIQLSNVNPQAHMANALCNLTRMEKAERWDNYGGITGTVGRLIEGLDRERLAVAQGFGVTVRTMQDHMVESFDLPRGSMAELAAGVVARGGSPGPVGLDARWLREDLPFGLVPTVAMATMVGVPAPLHQAGLTLFASLLGRDLAAENDLLPALGLDRMSAAALLARAAG